MTWGSFYVLIFFVLVNTCELISNKYSREGSKDVVFASQPISLVTCGTNCMGKSVKLLRWRQILAGTDLDSSTCVGKPFYEHGLFVDRTRVRPSTIWDPGGDLSPIMGLMFNKLGQPNCFMGLPESTSKA